MPLPNNRRPFRLGCEALEGRDNPAPAGFSAFGATAGGLPLVAVFDPAGGVVAQFAAFEESFRGGVRVATGELDGNPNTLEVAAAAGPGGASRVRVFSFDPTTGAVGTLADFFAFEPTYTNGLRVAVGDVNPNFPGAEIIVGADAGGAPRVQTFGLLNGTAFETDGPLGNFFAFEDTLRGGVRLAAGELDGNLFNGDELAVGAGVGGAPRVRVLRSDGTVFSDTFAGDPTVFGGVDLGFVAGSPFGTLSTDLLGFDFSQRSAFLNNAALAGFPNTVAGPFGLVFAPPAVDGPTFGGLGIGTVLPTAAGFGSTVTTSAFGAAPFTPGLTPGLNSPAFNNFGAFPTTGFPTTGFAGPAVGSAGFGSPAFSTFGGFGQPTFNTFGNFNTFGTPSFGSFGAFGTPGF